MGTTSVVSITVTPANPTLASLGATQQFVATARDAAGNVVGQGTITWSSSAVGVVTIDGSTGLATAMATPPSQRVSEPFPAAKDIEASWGSGGIAFVTDRDGVAGGALELYTIQPDGTGLTRLTNDLTLDFIPGWSADGTRIVFITIRDGGSFGGEIYIMNADGTSPTRITTDTAAEWAPKFIP